MNSGYCGKKIVKLGTSFRETPKEKPIEFLRSAQKFAGITRLSRIDPLCDIKVPIFLASRPHSRLQITVSSGKGLTEDESRLSAIFEGVEHAAADAKLPTIEGTKEEISVLGETIALEKLGAQDCFHAFPWLMVYEYETNRPVFVPSASVSLFPHNKHPFNPNTNGLASGCTFNEAFFHALLEIIERHNYSIALAHRQATTLEYIGDQESLSLIRLCEEKSLKVEVKDISWPTGVPSYFAMLVNDSERDTHLLGGGIGTHVDPVLALRRALLEAIQSRAIAIAGGREDLDDRDRHVGENYDLVRKKYAFWYEKTAERAALGSILPHFQDISLGAAIAKLLSLVRENDPVLGRCFYYSFPTPENIWVVKVILENAEVFGLYRDRIGHKLQQYFAKIGFDAVAARK